MCEADRIIRSASLFISFRLLSWRTLRGNYDVPAKRQRRKEIRRRIMTTYKNDSEIEAVVREFESCTTPAPDFTHERHVTVAIWYLEKHPFTVALKKMRDGLFRFIKHHHVDPGKYNETITVFWLKLTDQTLKQLSPELPLINKTNQVIAQLAHAKLIRDYYSDAVLWSAEAKQGWIEPDLKQITK